MTSSDLSSTSTSTTPIVAAYFPEWGIYGRDVQIADVPAEQLTHLIYAFARIDPSGQLALFDSYAATEKRFTEAGDAVGGEADQWYYAPEDPRSSQTIWGNFNQIAALKELHPHLRTSIAIGGWTLSGNFSTTFDTAAERELFADSVVSFLRTYTMFDGVDFDWEYPGGGGLESNAVSSADGANYGAALQLVRQKLDALGLETGRTYEISVAAPAGSDKIATLNLPELKEVVDFFNVMTYDFHGTWESATGHQAALQGDAIGYTSAPPSTCISRPAWIRCGSCWGCRPTSAPGAACSPAPAPTGWRTTATAMPPGERPLAPTRPACTTTEICWPTTAPAAGS